MMFKVALFIARLYISIQTLCLHEIYVCYFSFDGQKFYILLNISTCVSQMLRPAETLVLTADALGTRDDFNVISFLIVAHCIDFLVNEPMHNRALIQVLVCIISVKTATLILNENKASSKIT